MTSTGTITGLANTIENDGNGESNNLGCCKLAEDDFDDFADFQEADPLVNGFGYIDISTVNQSASPFSVDPNEPKSSEHVLPTSNIKAISLNQPLMAILPTLDYIVNQSFTKAIEDTSDTIEKSIITTDLFGDKKSQSYKIWQNLTNLEDSTSFRLNWESSHSFQVFLRSLKIDNKNIMDDFFVAAFEPSSESEELTMGSPITANLQVDQIVEPVTEPSESQSSSSPQLPALVPSQQATSTSTITPTTPSSSSSSLSSSSSSSSIPSTSIATSNESTEMPQVSQKQEQLMVSSSAKISSSASPSTASFTLKSTSDMITIKETTNQLDENQTTNNQLSNNLLDVTFFLNNPNFMQPCSSPKATAKVNESEPSIGNNESSAKPLSIISSSSTDPFHNLISQIQDASSMRTTNKSQSSTSNITTSDSNRIFEELPLLSFMRTKLLMFPMRDSIKD